MLNKMNTTKRLVVEMVVLSIIALFVGSKLLTNLMSEDSDEGKIGISLLMIAVVVGTYIAILGYSFHKVMPAGVKARARIAEQYAKRTGLTMSDETSMRIAEASLKEGSLWAEQLEVMRGASQENVTRLLGSDGKDVNRYLLYLAVFSNPIIKNTKHEQDETIAKSNAGLYIDIDKTIAGMGVDRNDLTLKELVRIADRFVNVHFRNEQIFELWQTVMRDEGRGLLIVEKNTVLRDEISELVEKYDESIVEMD